VDFGVFGLGSVHGGLSAPDMNRICEIVVIPDLVANVDALAVARAYAAVLDSEWRAAKQIGSTMAEGPWAHPANP
jgi:hypothetical protein